MEHKRNQTFQYLSVIGIISVIMGHVDLDTFPLMNTWFTPYSYHMALFVFISGYFYKSKNSESVIKEVQELVSNGHKEIVLTGIHTGSYNDNGKDLVDLINELSKIDGLLRIRLSSG